MLVRSVPAKARRAYKRDALAGFLVGIYAGAILPFYMIVARDQLHASTFLIGLMTAAPFAGNLMSLVWANAMQGRPKMPFVVWSGIVGRSLMVLMLLAVTPLRFALIICASHFLGAIAAPAYAAIMKDVYPDAHRGRIMGYIRVLLAFAMIVSAFIIGPILDYRGYYRWVFAAAAVFGIAASLSFSRIYTSPPSDDELANKRPIHEFLKSAFGILVHHREFRWFSLSIFTYGFGNLLLVPVAAVFQVDYLHMKTSQAAVLTNSFSIVWMISYLYWGKYVDVRSPVRAAMVSCLLNVLVPLNYFFASNVWMLFPAFIVSGIVAAGIELAYFNSVLHFAEEGREPHYQALFSWLMGLRGTLAPFLGASLIGIFQGQHWDIRYIFLISIGLMLTGALMQALGVRNAELRASTSSA